MHFKYMTMSALDQIKINSLQLPYAKLQCLDHSKGLANSNLWLLDDNYLNAEPVQKPTAEM